MGRTDTIPDRQAGRADASSAPALFILVLTLVAAAAILGGASRENALRLAGVELTALPLLALALRRGAPIETAPLALLGLILATPLAQLFPLPPALWTLLPGQAPRLESLTLAGLAPPWLPVSLSPGDTGRAALALLPPAAIFLGAASLDSGAARRVGLGWVGLAAFGLILGGAQLAAPDGGPAYLYATTNLGSLVGLFANRNHEAAFLLALAPIAAALAVGVPAEANRRVRRGGPPPPPSPVPALMGLFILTSVVALGVIRSRAGILLAGPALLLALAILRRGLPSGRRGPATVALAGVALVAAGAVALFSLTPILNRFTGAAAPEFRFEAWPHILAAAGTHAPLGSGLGSFDRVFQSVEPIGLVAPAYFNHAHNDYLELWLEAGWPAVLIFGLFLLWFVPAGLRAWREGPGLARAASAAILLLLAFSTVDYPLRTETLACLFGFCCGVLARRRRRDAT